MIYLTNGNMPLNAAYSDEIVQEENSTYQLNFRFPTSDPLWEKLKEETFLTADDLHGEQDFVIFEVEKKHGYIQVYANQVFTLLNNYVVNPISLDRQTGSTALSRFAGSITRDNPFSFFSDIEDRHTFNIGSKNAMEAFAKDKHSIIGQWGGDLVRHGYQVRLLKKGGSENESLFMYRKNLSSYQHKTSTKSLKTRITFIATVKGEGEKAPDRTFTVTIDSPLINKYSQIYEDVIEVNDQDVKDEASLRKYGEQYFKTSLCDMMEDSLELEVVGQSDVPVQMYDIVSLFYEIYNLDVRKKITKYTYSPMAKKLKSIGFGKFQSGLANAIGNAVSDAVKGEAQQLQDDFERQLAREIKNADLAFDRRKEELVNQFTDDVNAIKAKAEETKQELSDTIDQRFSSFDNGPLQDAKRKAEEALRNAGASSLLAQEAKRIGYDAMARLEAITNPRNGLIATQIATYKNAVDGRFADISSLLSGKANQTDFQRVRETSQLYERILGNTNNSIADNVARMAMASQLFQVEVAKSVGSDNNLIVRSKSMDRHTIVNEGNTKRVFVNNGIFTIRCTGNSEYTYAGFTLPLYIDRMARGETYTLNFKYRIMGQLDYNFMVAAKNHQTAEGIFYSSIATISTAVSSDWKEFNATYTISKDFEFGNNKLYPLYFYLLKNGWVEIKEIMLVRATQTNGYKASQLDDMSEAVRSVQSQLSGSWAVQNLTSAGSIVSQINATNNQILIEAEKIRLKGKTLLDELMAIQGYFKRLFVGEGTFATLNADVIRTNSITADKLVFNEAFANRLVSNEIITSKLVASRAFVNALNAVTIDASQIVTGTLKGDRIYGGTIRGTEINGTTITGNSRITIGNNGFLRPTQEGGLQINVPETFNASKGIGVQLFGRNFGQIPKGMFIYNSPNWDGGNLIGESVADTLLTVKGLTSLCNLYRGQPMSGLPINSNFRYGDPVGNLYRISFIAWDPRHGQMFVNDGTDTDGTWWFKPDASSSDKRLKTNIQDTDFEATDFVKKLEFKQFDWKPDKFGYKKPYTNVGLIAQDVEKLDSSLVYSQGENLALDDFRLGNIALKAIQELSQRIETLERKLA